MVLWQHVMLCGNTLLRVLGVLGTPSQLHSQQRIPTQHDMPPQHHVYRNELNYECHNITLARRKKAP